MVIGLLGFPFYDSNKGCEALTYSFVSAISQIYDDLTIISFSGNNIDIIKKSFPEISFVGYKMRLYNLIRHMKKCDYIVDCTYGDNFSDIYSLPFVSRTTLYKLMVIDMKGKLILAPQTIGPFENQLLKKKAVKILKKSAIVFSRDELSSKYTKEISGVDAITVTDLAFLLPYKRESYTFSKNEKIGINVSGLLWKGGFNQNNQFGLKMDYKQFVCELIEKLNQKGYEIHLIPHVIADENLTHDDDVGICQELSQQYGVKCAPAFKTPIEAKSYISNMAFFIGARMHSTIAAFSSGVPTIPVSYSRKFQGLYNTLGYNYIIDAKKLDEKEALELVLTYLDDKDSLVRKQNESLIRIKELEDKFLDALRQKL